MTCQMKTVMRRAGNLLICSSLICSFRSNQMSESLRSLRGYERPWVNCSGRSRQMRDHEQCAQVAQRKWANERFAQKIRLKKSKILFQYVLYTIFKKMLLKKWANRSFFWANRKSDERIPSPGNATTEPYINHYNSKTMTFHYTSSISLTNLTSL